MGVFQILFTYILIAVLLFVQLCLLIKTLFFVRRLINCNEIISVGFFHPYCNAGGGGERVLWTAIRFLQNRYNNVRCIVYTGDTEATKENILEKVESRFNITFPRDIDFVFLRSRPLVEAKKYPYFTLLFQSLSSVFLGIEALFKFLPDIYIDTMGYAFTYPLFKYIGGSKIACYVHYPTISTDMFQTVYNRMDAVNNRKFISESKILSSLKLKYYKIFACLYSIMGRTADIIMVNSSWTRGHIDSLWKVPSKTYVVYPPCDTTTFKKFPFPDSDKNGNILSVAQFRPEKNHELQIKAFHKLLSLLPKEKNESIVLTLVGSCRDEEDKLRIEKLKKLCSELGISEKVNFKVNLSFADLLCEMKNAGISIHTMWNEHFGIGVVECMAAGLIMIAHDSGGPKMDIVIDFNSKKTGYLAYDVDSFADAMKSVLELSSEEQLEIRENARESVDRFSVENFEESFGHAINEFFL